MKVILAKSAGFCRGVERAVQKARELARKNNSTSSDPSVFTDGPLMHNEQMMRELSAQGITQCDDPGSIPSEINATVIIRAHGVPPEHRNNLKSLSVELIDATCPDVARIQGSIKKYALRGYCTIIFGDDGHAEVTGLLGFADNRGHVVSSPDDVMQLPAMEKVCLVAQSTQLPLKYAEIIEAVKALYPDAIIIDTICDSTKDRQNELTDICKKADAVVIVGGKHSANTIRLVELAHSLKPTYHIQTASDIDTRKLSEYKTIALSAGASTPSFVIEEVKKKLESI